MTDPKDDVETEVEDGTPSDIPAQGVKRPRSLAAMLAIVGLIILLTLIGIITAALTHSEDPAGVQIPAYTAKSLSETQPVDTTGMYQNGDESIPVLPAGENGQTESPINLDDKPAVETPAVPAPEEKETPSIFDDKKPDVAPQSMIQWDDAPKVAAITPQAVPLQGHGKIAIVIDDMGLNRINSQRMVDLPGQLTLSYLPYADNLQAQADTARGHGHELMVHMPMEPDDLAHNNPGPNALLMANSAQENIERLQKNLARFNGYMGMNNHMGSRFTSSPEEMRLVMQTLKEKGLWFLDSKTIGNSAAAKTAAEYGVPYAERDIFLDNTASVPAIMAQLRQLEHVANKRGYAVAIGHPYAATIAALKEWMPSAQQRGFVLVPLSEVIAARFPNAAVPQYAQARHKSSAITQNAIEPAAGVAAVTNIKSEQVN